MAGPGGFFSLLGGLDQETLRLRATFPLFFLTLPQHY